MDVLLIKGLAAIVAVAAVYTWGRALWHSRQADAIDTLEREARGGRHE